MNAFSSKNQNKDLYALIDKVGVRLNLLKNKLIEVNSFFVEPDKKSSLISEIENLKYDIKLSAGLIAISNGYKK